MNMYDMFAKLGGEMYMEGIRSDRHTNTPHFLLLQHLLIILLSSRRSAGFSQIKKLQTTDHPNHLRPKM